ncbi:MAG: HGGxSTG domain-containing protein [Alphaproteobacteria bacterium]
MPENPNPFAGTARCGARTRAGTPCQGPAITGSGRCRMHGGAGSGAPGGNVNAFTDGFYRADAKEHRRRMNAFIRAMTEQVEMYEALGRRGGAPEAVTPPSLPDPGYEVRSDRYTGRPAPHPSGSRSTDRRNSPS